MNSFREKEKKFFNENGYAVIPNFLTSEQCDILRRECDKLVDSFDPSQHPNCIFTTSEKQNRDEYFITSGDKIRYFFEEKALNSDGKLIVPKNRCLNKIGHALHSLHPVFREYSSSPSIQNILKTLAYKHPAIAQSMYIFKQPKIGGEVNAHQDSTFLRTKPSTVLGFWFALEDCTKENGCLWFIPGSHKKGEPERQFIRTDGGKSTKFIGAQQQFDDKLFVCGEVKKGSLVLIHGAIVHKSGMNMSEKSRHIYTFHVIETDPSVVYSPENWLQPTAQVGFTPLY
eukprot:Sdes_comp18722_c0_seq2m9054